MWAFLKTSEENYATLAAKIRLWQMDTVQKPLSNWPKIILNSLRNYSSRGGVRATEQMCYIKRGSYLLWLAQKKKKCIEAFYAYESECVCTCNRRDEAGKQQCPLRRVHPHRGLVTRWAAGSPLSLASWGRLSAGNSERTVFPSQKKKMISISSSPHTNVPLPQWWAGADSEQRITSI